MSVCVCVIGYSFTMMWDCSLQLKHQQKLFYRVLCSLPLLALEWRMRIEDIGSAALEHKHCVCFPQSLKPQPALQYSPIA
jgi:hypothetical protein